jgi:beta-glucanase (GH16 family)
MLTRGGFLLGSGALVAGAGVAGCAASPMPAPASSLSPFAPVRDVESALGMRLVWSDEFGYAGLPDARKWRYDVGAGGWGNDELEYYTDARLTNAHVGEGALHITARRETYRGSAYTSARLLSAVSWTYGRIDVCAKMPGGRGTWPAIWMFPQHQRYGQDPRSGEIDIVENVGYDPLMIYPTIHTQKFDSAKKTLIAAKRVPTVDTAYHVYSVDWTATGMDISFDGTPYLSYHPTAAELKNWRAWPYNEPFFLILNVAVGGSWGGLRGVDAAAFPRTMDVAYVRVYQ